MPYPLPSIFARSIWRVPLLEMLRWHGHHPNGLLVNLPTPLMNRPIKHLNAPLSILGADLLLKAPHRQTPSEREPILGSVAWKLLVSSKSFPDGRGGRAYRRRREMEADLGRGLRKSFAYYYLP